MMMSNQEFSFVITDDMLREVHHQWEQQKLKNDNPFVFDLIKVLAKYRNGAKRSVVLDLIMSNRRIAGLDILPSFDETVQAAMNFNCQDSDVFRLRNVPSTEALFSWPKEKGAGFWMLQRDNTRQWLNRRSGRGE